MAMILIIPIYAMILQIWIVLKIPKNNRNPWIQMMVWHQTGHMILAEPMRIQFTDAYVITMT